jgi:hypothetical protein
MTARRRAAAKIEKPPTSALRKADPGVPALLVTAGRGIAIRGGIWFAQRRFAGATTVPLPKVLEPGADYVVLVGRTALGVDKLTGAALPDNALGGFHFAPGGNAKARAGGDAVPAINPCSLWDLSFRPACDDPRGMALITAPTARRFWCDIYLLGVDHLQYGTSRFDVVIADGTDGPQRPDGNGLFDKFDYAAALAVMKHHGKGLLGFEEFGSAAYGVTEKTAAGSDPKITGLDAPRTSKFGLMQATGNVWVWGHDGDPDEPRASIFGGSWLSDGDAGSRCAFVDYWPGVSVVILGARGRCDHLMRV